jgi:hypothetical protein
MGACILRGMAKLCQATLVWRVGPTVRGFVEGPHCLRHTTHTDKKELFATCCAPPKHTLLGLANPSCHLCRVNKGHVLTWPHVEGPLDPTTRPFCGRSLLDNRDSSTQKADIRTSTTHTLRTTSTRTFSHAQPACASQMASPQFGRLTNTASTFNVAMAACVRTSQILEGQGWQAFACMCSQC